MSKIIISKMKRITVRGLILATGTVALATLFTAIPAVAVPTLPVLWTAGGLSSGTDSAGQAGRIAVDTSGNVAVVSGPSGGRDLAVTSYTSTGSLRWRSTVSPSLGTFVGDWVAAAPNGDFLAVGHNIDSHGRAIASTLIRYASDGTLLWREDISASFFPAAARLVVDSAGNAYLAWSAVGSGLFVQKYSPSGALLWSQQDSTGGGYAIATSLALSPDEADVVATGDVSGGATWITAVYDAATGVNKWEVTAAEGTAARDVVVDSTHVYVTGLGTIGLSNYLTVVAYDRTSGARLWRTDANPPTCCAYGSRIALAPDGSLVVAGQMSSGGYFDWWIVAFNSDGTVRWQVERDAAVSGDEFPAAVLVLADGTTVVSGTGGPVIRDILGNSYMQGVTAGYGADGTLLWEAFSKLPTVWATALPSGDVCATGGYDALITCFDVGVSNQPPTAVVSATPLTGVAPLTVTFNGSGSTDPDGTIASYSWTFGDGATSTATNPSHTYTSAGTFTAALTVTDNAGATASASVTITVTPSTAKTLRSTAINLSATRSGSRVSASGQVVVRDAANKAVSGVSVNITWRRPDGTSVTQTTTTGSTGTASFSTSGGVGTYTLTVKKLTKTGYTFDAANSILTKSITK